MWFFTVYGKLASGCVVTENGEYNIKCPKDSTGEGFFMLEETFNNMYYLKKFIEYHLT